MGKLTEINKIDKRDVNCYNCEFFRNIYTQTICINNNSPVSFVPNEKLKDFFCSEHKHQTEI